MAGERILLVDDNPVNLRLTRAILAMDGHEIAAVASAEEALAVIDGFRPQLVVTDVRLTGMDGLEFARRLRASAEWRKVPIIAVTGMNSAEDEQQAMEAGCNAFLAKPIQTQMLRRLVRWHLEGPGPDPDSDELPEGLAASLRAEFIRTGVEKCRRLLALMPAVAPARNIAPAFDYEELRKALHNWAGGGGTFGLPRVTDTARQAEELLSRPFETIAAPLRTLMSDLLEMFTHPPPAVLREGEKAARPVVAEGALADRRPVVLICDDDPLVVKMIRTTLESNGMVCRTADNGRLALAMVRNHRPDAVVLDVNMPALDGIQVLDELRRLESTRRLKVMLLTARQSAEDITRGVYHGADDYMAKPFDPNVLVERVRAMLARDPA